MATCAGYSKDEYVAAVAAALEDHYVITFEEAYKLATQSREVQGYDRGYSGMGRNGDARSPRRQADAIARGQEDVGDYGDRRRVRLQSR